MRRGGMVVRATVVVNHLPRMTRELKTEAKRIVDIVTVKMSESVMSSMEGPKGGRLYRVPGLAGVSYHRASRPGEAPAVLFGQLKASIDWRTNIRARWITGEAISGVVFSSDRKAPHLEYGTVRMAPRPFMRPAAVKFRPIFEMMMRSAVARATRT